MERGAKRNTEPWRATGADPDETTEQRLDRLEREEAEAAGNADDETDAMAELEAKLADARRDMAVADALDEVRRRNARIERADKEGLDAGVGAGAGAGVMTDKEREEREKAEALEREDAEAWKRAVAFASKQAAEMEEEEIWDDTASSGTGDGGSTAGDAVAVAVPPPKTFRVVKKNKKQELAKKLGIKR